MKAAVLREVRTPLQIEDVKISKPGPHEVLVRTACFSGDVSEGEAAARPLRALGTPIADGLGPMPFTAVRCARASASAMRRTRFRSIEPSRMAVAMVFICFCLGAERPQPRNTSASVASRVGG